MRSARLLIPAFLALVLAAFAPAAAAKCPGVAPPGNSAVGEYVESVPGSCGNSPARSLPGHVGRSGHRAGGGARSGARTGGAGALTPGVRRRLLRSGQDGRGLAALADGTSPLAAGGRHSSGRTTGSTPRRGKTGAPGSAAGGTGAGGGGTSPSGGAGAGGGGTSPSAGTGRPRLDDGTSAPAAAARALTGESGGMGVALPLVLGLGLGAALALVVVRRRLGGSI
jgi:hypothetical protein